MKFVKIATAITLACGFSLSAQDVPIAEIPYFWNDGYDLSVEGLRHALYIYTQPQEKWGLCSWYQNVNGETLKSPMVSYYIASGDVIIEEDPTLIIDLQTSTNDNDVEYYTLSGIRVHNPAPGSIVIKKHGSKSCLKLIQ